MAITFNGTTNVITPTTAVQPQHAIVNVHQAIKTDTASEEVEDNTESAVLFSTNYAAISSSNKLLIQMSLIVGGERSSGNAIFPILMIGGSAAAYRGDAAGNRTRSSAPTYVSSEWYSTSITITYLLSSPSTSSTAYGVAFRHGNNGTEAVYLNRAHHNNDEYWMARGASSITLTEIQG